MPEKQAGGLSLRIGLTLSQLQSDFLAAEQTVKQGIAALNRQQNLVRLKMEADVSGLDAVVDKTRIVEVQERALNQILEMQRDKLTLATAAYQDYVNSKNANVAVSKNLETAMERERLAVARLEAQLKSLSAQRISIDTTKLQDNIAKLNAKIQHVKITAEIDTSKLQGANAAFDAQKVHIAAVTRELELQRQKLIQLREAMYQSAKNTGGDSTQTFNIKSNVLQQIQEITRLENKLKELQSTNINLQIRADSIRQAEQTINDNIARLNARIENVKVKTDIDLTKLGAAAGEFDKAKAHVQGLNRELDLQNQKLAELKKALGSSVSANGLNNVKTINLQTEIQRQIQAIDQLKAKIKELNDIPPPKTNNLLSGYLNIKGNVIGSLNEISSVFNSLQGATSSVDNAITATLTVIGAIPHPVGRVIAAFAAMLLVLKGLENSIVDLTRAAAAAGDSTYVMSRGFQMSLAETGKFTAMCKTAGVEVNDLASTIKRTQQQIIRSGEDSKAEKWLKRYGESAFDASGHLKDLNAMTLTLSRALKKAQAEGNGMAFIFATMRNASADAITAIEDAEDVYKQAAGLVKNGLLDPKFAHEVQGNINAMNLQAGYMNAAFSSALLPVANEIVPRLTERMGKLTQIIADNKDVIREFGRTAAEAFLKIEEGAEAVGGALARVGKFFVDLKKNPRQDEFVLKYQNDFNIKTVDDLIKKEQAAAFDVIKANPTLYQQALSIYQPLFKAIDDAHKEIKRKNEELKKELEKQLTSVADLSSVAADRLKVEKNPDLLKGAESLKKILQEASDIQYKLSHTDFENKKLDLLQQQQDMLNQAEMTAEKREAIEKLGTAKLAQIEQEHADKLKEIRANVEAADKTALQNKLDNIEKERESWIKIGMEEAEATELAQKKIAKAYEESNAKVQEHLRNAADIEYELTHTAFEKQLRDIVAWEDAEHRKAETAEEVAAVVKEAAMKEAEAFEREIDRIKNLTQSLEDEIFEMENSQYEVDIRRAKQKAQRALDEGVDATTVQRYLRDKFGQLDKRAAESREKDGDYTKRPEGALGGGYIGLFTDENKIRQQILPQMDEYAQVAVAQIESTKALTAAQQDLTQDFQAVTGDAVLEMPTQELQQFGDAIQQITAPLSESADAQQAVTDSAKKFSPELQRLTESTKSLVEVQNKLVQELSEEKTPLSTDGAQKFKELARKLKENDGTFPNATSATKIQDVQVPKAQAGKNLSSELLAPVMDIGKSVQSLQQKESEIKFPDLLAPLTSIDEKFQSLLQEDEPRESDRLQELIGTLPNIEEDVKSILLALQREPEEPTPQDKRETVNVALEIPAAEKTTPAAAIELPSVEPAGEINFARLITPLEELNNSAQEILQELQALQSTEETPESADYSSELASLDLNVQSILEELQSRDTTPETVAAEVIDYTVQLASIDEDIKSIVPALQGKETVAPIDYTSLLTNINENIQAILQEDLRCRIQSAKDCPPLPEISVATEQAAAPQIGLPNYSDILTKIRDGVQSLFQHKETQAETNKDYSLQLAAIGEDVQGILAELQRRNETPAPTEMPSTETADYSATLNRISETVQGILQTVQTPQETSGTTLEAPAAIDYSAQLSALPAISETTQSILQELQQPESRMDFSELVTPLTSLDEKVQGLLQAVQTEEPQETLGMETFVDLPVISANVQSILQELQTAHDTPTAPAAETIDYLTPLVSIDGNLQSVLQHLQSPPEQSTMPDYSATLSDIGGNVQSILRTVQSREKISLTTVVTPLNKIEAAIGNIVNALNNRKPAQITVSPNNSIDLGGAYVFDNAMKQQLVNDITKTIVDEITTSVRNAISQTSYGYSA